MREMKHSGIEWIGDIPIDWNVGKIGNQYTERKTKVSDIDYPPLSVTMKGILPLTVVLIGVVRAVYPLWMVLFL